ncbi:hypothetical protein Syun_014512 [Stephania yunnanensis]|uniref:Uncharacterized protein n=1 Tax=Stephania yunnanensis TaxID=152371 RepID=A0AAP0JLT6_9MAGN
MWAFLQTHYGHKQNEGENSNATLRELKWAKSRGDGEAERISKQALLRFK